MKLLGCPFCDTGHASLDREGRVPYTLSIYPRTGREFRVACQRCRRASMITVQEFNSLPDLTGPDLERLGLVDHVALDLTLGGPSAGGLTMDQARDLVLAGWRLSDVHALEPQTPR